MCAMTTYSPRKSALNLLWNADFRRSYTGIAKQGGTVTGTVPLSGRWATLAGAQYITYPSIRFNGLAEITFGAWVQDVSGAGYQTVLSNTDAATSGFYLHTPDGWGNLNVGVFISGTLRTVSAAFPGGKAFLVATWKSGDYIRLYSNGTSLGTSAATYTGALSENVLSVLQIGAVLGIQILNGKIADPFIMNRQLSAQEVSQLYSNSTLR